MPVISETTVKDRSFPKLMEMTTNAGCKVVVLFSAKRVGTIVHSETALYDEGTHCTYWDMKYFKDYEDELVLKNEV